MIAKPIKPYPAMKDSGVPWLGEVPKHWRLPRLGALLRERGETNGDGRVSEVLSVLRERGVIPYAEKGNIGNRKSEDITRYKVVRLDDIVVNCMNVIIGSVGISSYIGCLSPVYYVLTRRSERDHPGYLNAYFQTQSFQESLVRIGNGILAHRMRIPMELLKCEPFPRPPSEEQAAIVRFLDHADRRIRRYIRAKQRLIASLEEQKQAIIHQAVTGQVDVRTGQPYPAYKPSGVEWLGDVPEHWQLLRLKNVAHVQTGLTLGKDYRGTRTTSRPYLRVANVQEGCLDLTHVKSIDVPLNEADRATLLTGDVLMTEGGDIDKLGRGCVWRDEISKCLHQNHIFAVRCKHGLLSPEFLVGLMASQHGRAYFELTAKQTTNLASTNSSTLRAFPMPLPVLEEQVAIHTVLSEETNAMDHAMGQAEREIDLMREYRTRLIADVVTGKLDVREAATGLPEVDLLADEFDVLTEAPETGMMELEDANETPEELAMENEATV